jgi:uncharacterized protein (TIGR03067 family)
MYRFALTLVVGCSLVISARADDKSSGDKSRRLGAEEAKAMEGTWKLVKGEMGGAETQIDRQKPITLEITGFHYVVTTSDRKDEGDVRLFPDKSPKAIDVIGTKGPNAGKTIPAIYELKGGRLKVCYDLSEKQRPKEFKTAAGTMDFLAVYERVKK